MFLHAENFNFLQNPYLSVEDTPSKHPAISSMKFGFKDGSRFNKRIILSNLGFILKRASFHDYLLDHSLLTTDFQF